MRFPRIPLWIIEKDSRIYEELNSIKKKLNRLQKENEDLKKKNVTTNRILRRVDEMISSREKSFNLVIERSAEAVRLSMDTEGKLHDNLTRMRVLQEHYSEQIRVINGLLKKLKEDKNG